MFLREINLIQSNEVVGKIYTFFNNFGTYTYHKKCIDILYEHCIKNWVNDIVYEHCIKNWVI